MSSWNPERKLFTTNNTDKSGGSLDVPQEIIEAMPLDIALDGEIWYSPFLPPRPPLNKLIGYSQLRRRGVEIGRKRDRLVSIQVYSFRFSQRIRHLCATVLLSG